MNKPETEKYTVPPDPSAPSTATGVTPLLRAGQRTALLVDGLHTLDEKSTLKRKRSPTESSDGSSNSAPTAQTASVTPTGANTKSEISAEANCGTDIQGPQLGSEQKIMETLIRVSRKMDRTVPHADPINISPDSRLQMEALLEQNRTWLSWLVKALIIQMQAPNSNRQILKVITARIRMKRQMVDGTGPGLANSLSMHPQEFADTVDLLVNFVRSCIPSMSQRVESGEYALDALSESPILHVLFASLGHPQE